MTLTVKARIGIAMTLLVAVNTLGAVLTWNAFAVASRHGASARAASEEARSVETAATKLTQFVADSRALAFAVSRSEVSEDSSVSYGRLQGAEADVTTALRALERTEPDGALTAQWDALRTTTYLWVNREAGTADSPFRLTVDDKGRFRASVASNITEPASIAAMTDEELSREVRDASEVLKNGTLRRMVESAEADARAASALEQRARDTAVRTALLLAVLGIGVAVVAATWLYRSIAIPLSEARAFADRVEAGDLAATFPRHRNDEIGALTREVEQMKDAVVRRIATMREMAGVVLFTAETVRSEAVAADAPRVVASADTLLGLATQMLED